MIGQVQPSRAVPWEVEEAEVVEGAVEAEGGVLLKHHQLQRPCQARMDRLSSSPGCSRVGCPS